MYCCTVTVNNSLVLSPDLIWRFLKAVLAGVGFGSGTETNNSLTSLVPRPHPVRISLCAGVGFSVWDWGYSPTRRKAWKCGLLWTDLYSFAVSETLSWDRGCFQNFLEDLILSDSLPVTVFGWGYNNDLCTLILVQVVGYYLLWKASSVITVVWKDKLDLSGNMTAYNSTMKQWSIGIVCVKNYNKYCSHCLCSCWLSIKSTWALRPLLPWQLVLQ